MGDGVVSDAIASTRQASPCGCGPRPRSPPQVIGYRVNGHVSSQLPAKVPYIRPTLYARAFCQMAGLEVIRYFGIEPQYLEPHSG